MLIQPISSAYSQTNFQAYKLPRLKVKHRKPNLTPEQEQRRNYTQAVIVGLTLLAAMATKYIIDFCNGKHKQTSAVEVSSKPQNTVADSKTIQL